MSGFPHVTISLFPLWSSEYILLLNFENSSKSMHAHMGMLAAKAVSESQLYIVW